MKKILVIQTASIGDVVLATALLEQLHSNFPDAKLDILVKKGIESLFEDHPFIGKVWIWNKRDKKYLNLLALIAEIRNEKYDIVVNVQRFLSSGLITLFSKAKQRIGFSKNPLSLFFTKRVKHLIDKDRFIHEIDRNYLLIEDICKREDKKYYPRLYPTKKSDAKMSEYKRGIYYTVSAASLWYTKQFHKQGWIDFLSRVDKDSTIYLLGGANDLVLCEEIKQSINHLKCINLAGKLTFLDSCSLMRDAKMNFTNDSAPLHFCSSVNAPITAIFCCTTPEFGFTPLSDDSVIIQSELLLSCKPCGLHGYKQCPKQHFNCSKTIDINKLVARL